MTKFHFVVTILVATTAAAFAPSKTTTATRISFVAQRHHKQTLRQQAPPVPVLQPLWATLEEDATADKDKKAAKADSFIQESFADDSDAVVITKDSTLLGPAIPYADLTIGVLKEVFDGENRVSQTPDSVRSLTKAGLNVVVEKGGTSIRVVVTVSLR